jgi:hypothetical protein
VTAVPLLKQRNSIPDVAACFPAVKAAIDGIVDAGTIPDDDPSHLVSICFHAPEFGEKNGLRVTIHKHDTGEDDE